MRTMIDLTLEECLLIAGKEERDEPGKAFTGHGHVESTNGKSADSIIGVSDDGICISTELNFGPEFVTYITKLTAVDENNNYMFPVASKVAECFDFEKFKSLLTEEEAEEFDVFIENMTILTDSCVEAFYNAKKKEEE